MDETSPEIRASDAERERAVDLLRENLAEGRIALEEFSQRVDAAHRARTRRELENLARDLPVAAAPALPGRRRPVRWSVAVMGGAGRRSRWRVAEHTFAVAVMGGCILDLRRAEIESDEVQVTAVAVMGGVEVIVPEGIEVELSGFALMGGNDERVGDASRVPGTPLVRVRAFGLMGGVTVRSKRRSSGVQAIEAKEE